MIILIDMDGPVADFEQGFLNGWRSLYPDEPFIPLEERTTHYVREQYPPEQQAMVESVYGSPDFFLNLPVIPGALEAINEMSQTHEVYFCSAPLRQYQNCVEEKYAWVDKHLGAAFVRRIIFTKDKTLIRGDILIEDNSHVHGNVEPLWEHIIFDRPYNRQVTNKRRITWETWRSVIN